MPRLTKWYMHTVRVFKARTESAAATAFASEARDSYANSAKKIEVRAFPRTVRAGGATVPLIIVVVRSKVRREPLHGESFHFTLPAPIDDHVAISSYPRRAADDRNQTVAAVSRCFG
jgi:hypothetical protein